jgi:hypothetical protein
MAQLMRIFEGKELLKLRHPLQGALLFSPLYLLTGRKLSGNQWDQSKMIQASRNLVQLGVG